jgi:hypothetical protein
LAASREEATEIGKKARDAQGRALPRGAKVTADPRIM